MTRRFHSSFFLFFVIIASLLANLTGCRDLYLGIERFLLEENALSL